MFVTDSRYEIAVKDEVDHEVFDVSTKADSMKTVLSVMATDGEEKIRVGLDGHLFTKTSVDALMKTEGVELIVNLDSKAAEKK